VNVAAGEAVHAIDRIGDGQHVIGQRPLEASLLALRGTEVDDPGIDSVLPEDGDRAGSRRHVVDLRGQHHRRDQDHRRALPLIGVVAPQPVDPLLGGHLVRRRLVLGGKAAKPRDLQRVLGSDAEPRGAARDRVRDQRHAHIISDRGSGCRSSSRPLPRAIVHLPTREGA
jgi:hypothetical protein